MKAMQMEDEVGWNKKRARPVTNGEKDALEYIEKLLDGSPNEKIFTFIKIKCATEDGFFDKMMKHAFAGFYTQNDNLREEVSTLSSALFIAERCITKEKKAQKKFKETFRFSILKGLKIARKFMNLDDIITEYEAR